VVSYTLASFTIPQKIAAMPNGKKRVPVVS